MNDSSIKQKKQIVDGITPTTSAIDRLDDDAASSEPLIDFNLKLISTDPTASASTYAVDDCSAWDTPNDDCATMKCVYPFNSACRRNGYHLNSCSTSSKKNCGKGKTYDKMSIVFKSIDSSFKTETVLIDFIHIIIPSWDLGVKAKFDNTKC